MYYPIMLDVPAHTSGAVAYKKLFGSTTDRLGSDYARSLALMRKNYAVQCAGDPNEIRSADEF
jgi:hypothetical protein